MTWNEAAEAVLSNSGVSRENLARALGYDSVRGLNIKLARDNSSTVKNLSELLGLLGYKLVAVPEFVDVSAVKGYHIEK